LVDFFFYFKKEVPGVYMLLCQEVKSQTDYTKSNQTHVPISS